MKSLCPNKDVCGSCSWSEKEYAAQITDKVLGINDAFLANELDLVCNEIIPSPKLEHYRNRMDFVINFQGLVGLREKGKWWKVIDNHTCFLADKKIEDAFEKVKSWAKTCELSFFDRKAHTGLLRYAVIRSTIAGEVMLIIVTSLPENKAEEDKITRALKTLAEQARPTTLIWAKTNSKSDISYGEELVVISGEGFVTEHINEFTYKITPNAFFQTNSHAAKILQTQVLAYAQQIEAKRVLDLYCGSGFFTLPLAKLFGQVTGIELVEQAILDAKDNAASNNIQNIEFVEQKAEEIDLLELNPDLLILDPPRTGLQKKTLEKIVAQSPENIIYVSCNYKRFAEEMKTLKGIYSVPDMKAIDMFPHTPHVELIARLEKL